MFNRTSKDTDERVVALAKKTLKKMTLKEKVWLLNGVWDPVKNTVKHNNPYNPTPIMSTGCKRLGISPIKFTDGPRGVVMNDSTCFPVSMARGASFDRDLEQRVGDVIGKEARAGGANYFAGVCINLLRHPAWGRAQETYGEDPFHVGEMGKALTESVQGHNVMACIKHYALNSIENSRFRVNVEVDERALREVYLPHFKKCVKAGAASVMGAYNLFRKDYACQSKHLLTNILRDDWGFQGFTSSDFMFGIRNTKKAIEAGMDVEMPLPVEYQRKLLKAVKEGKISHQTLDTAVLRVLKTIFAFESCEEKMKYDEDLIGHKKHAELALEVAEKSMVMIKNENNVLPFSKEIKKVLIVGKLATKANVGDHGSSRTYPKYVVTQLEGFKNFFGDSVEVIHLDETQTEKAKQTAALVDAVVVIVGNDAFDEGESVVPDEKSGLNMQLLIADAMKNMRKPLKAMILKKEAKKNEGKDSYTSANGVSAGGDRAILSLKQREIDLIKAIGRVNPNTVVTLIGGSMIMTKEWDNDVPAILYGWYSGMEGGNALPRVLFGEVNPGGKLPFSIPVEEKQLPYFSSDDDEITYGMYHGYTLLDKNGFKPAYPFGFGLSYTSFSIGGLNISEESERVKISVEVKNTGIVTGSEVVQVYVGMDDSKIERQVRLLKGFEKVLLNQGESKTVNIYIPLDELKYFSEKTNSWEFEEGVYNFTVGNSSCDVNSITKKIMLSKG